MRKRLGSITRLRTKAFNNQLESESMMIYQYKIITPEIATDILKKQSMENNRPISKGHVKKLADMMENGDWIENGDTLRFDTKGKLLDGQHRLSAVIKCGKPLAFGVVSDIPPEAFMTVDTGKKRYASDALSIHDGNITNSTTVAAIIRQLYSHQQTGNVGYSAYSPTNKHMVELYDYYNEDGLLLNAASFGQGFKIQGSSKLVKASSPASLGFCFSHFSKIDLFSAKLFFDKVKSGSGEIGKDPCRALYNRFIEESGVSEYRKDIFRNSCYIVSTWNSFRAGKDRKIFQPSKRLPVIHS